MMPIIKKVSTFIMILLIISINLTGSIKQTLFVISKPEVSLTLEATDITADYTRSEVETLATSDPELLGKDLSQPPMKQIQKSPYKELLNINEDYVAWIKISGTQVDYPIVKGSDNDYYLNRQFDKSYHKSGAIFMDYRNFGFGYSKNTVLYGHNMKDGTMFGSLKYFKDGDFATTNNLITIEDLYGIRTYQVFSSYFAKSDSSMVQLNFEGTDYELYLQKLVSSSQYGYPIKPNSNHPILTLITCSYEIDDGRYFIHAMDITDSIK